MHPPLSPEGFSLKSLCICTYFFLSSFLYTSYILWAFTWMCHGEYVVTEDSYWEWILSFHHVSLEDQTHLVDLPFFFMSDSSFCLTSLLCEWIIAGYNSNKSSHCFKGCSSLLGICAYESCAEDHCHPHQNLQHLYFTAELGGDQWCSDNWLCNFTRCFIV